MQVMLIAAHVCMHSASSYAAGAVRAGGCGASVWQALAADYIILARITQDLT